MSDSLRTDLYAAYLSGGVEAAVELAKARGLVTGELSDAELELVAGGKDNGRGIIQRAR